jgi:hypothetical protein
VAIPRSDDAVDFGVLVTPDRIDFGPQLDKPSRSFGMQMRGGRRPVSLVAFAQGAAGNPRQGSARVLVVGLALILLEVACNGGPEPPEGISSLTWSRVPHDEAVFGGEGQAFMNGVVAGGPGLVAVGSVWGIGGEDAAVWTSPDGLTWSRVPYDEAIFGGDGRQVMNDVTAGGPGLVAVGYDGPEGEERAAVWTSPDGVTWSQIPHDEAVFGGEGPVLMNGVTSGGPGLVAVGSAGPMTPQEAVAAVWTSPDGLTWSRVPYDEAIFGGRGNLFMNSVAAGGPGLVAVRGTHSWQRGDPAPVWTSLDGISWSRVPDDEAVFDGVVPQGVTSVAVGGPGLVAVGGPSSTGDQDVAAVWTSPDGIIWSRVPHTKAVFGGEGPTFMNSVTLAGETELLAVGGALGPSDATAAVWASPDGLTWSRVIPDDEAVFGGGVMNSLTAGGPGLVAVGYVAGVDRFPDAAVWVAARE